jgi:hypothetical protein
MEFLEALQQLERDASFRSWRKTHAGYYLVHGFYEAAEAGKEERWQVGFYDRQADRIITFVVGQSITELPPAEAFKEAGAIPALDTGEVRLPLADALAAARKALAEHYPRLQPLRSFLIIQRLEDGTVYNITFLTAAFKTVNVKLSARTGAVLHHCLVELADFGQVLKQAR